MKNSFKIFAGIILLLAQLSAHATEGNLFTVVSSGTSAMVDITLCLNGKAKLSCEDEKVTALDLLISTTVPNRLYPDAGIFINTPGYSIASLGIACSLYSPTGYCIFGVSSTAPASISLQSNNVIKNTRFAYIGNYDISQVVQCVVKPDGSFGTCSAIPALDSMDNDLFNYPSAKYPMTVAFNPAGTIAYISTYYYDVIQCNVDSTTGLFSGCTVAYTNGASSALESISVNDAGTFAYISPEDGVTSMIVCAIDAGNLNGSSCTSTTWSTFDYPTNVLFDSAGTHAYVGVWDNLEYMFLCEVGMTSTPGDLSSCSQVPSTSGEVKGPSGLAFNPSKSIIYVANYDFNGTTPTPLSYCAVASSPFTCVNTGDNPSIFSEPLNIAVNSAGTFAYVTDNSNETVIGCSINASTGALSGCVVVASNPTPYSLFYSPFGITLLD